MKGILQWLTQGAGAIVVRHAVTVIVATLAAVLIADQQLAGACRDALLRGLFG